MSDTEKMMEKIKKLLALGQNNTNPNEASAAMAMAQRLMEANNLTQSQIRLSDISKAFIKSAFSVSKLKPFENNLMWAVSDAFGVKILWTASKSNFNDNWARFTIVGPKSRVAIAEYTAVYLIRKMAAARAEFVRTLPPYLTRAQKSQEGDGFCAGWANALRDKIQKFANPEADLIDEFLADELRGKKPVDSQKRKLGAMGYQAGQIEGSKESLHRPMGKNAGPLQIEGGR